jgi:hypothetical protein
MEFFIPGLCLFIISIIVTFIISPKITPIVAAILSIIFLIYGVREHYELFASEYRLSTWHEGLKIYAPAIMIISIILFIIYGIFGFFTTGKVPVPSLPNINLPNTNTTTESIIESLNSVANSISNTANNILSINSNNGSVNKNNGNVNKNKKNGNNISRSFLETI